MSRTGASSKAARAKAVATRKANAAARLAAQVKSVNEILARVKLATTYLMQAEHKMTKPYSEAELYSLLALRVLTIKGS